MKSILFYIVLSIINSFKYWSIIFICSLFASGLYGESLALYMDCNGKGEYFLLLKQLI